MRILFMAFIVFIPAVATAQDSSCDTLEAVAWMAGTWSTESGARKTVEHWQPISEKTMEGWGRVFRSETGELTGEETLRLVEMSGEVFYVAKVGGNPFPVPFKLVSCGPGTATFENMDHDFPRRLEYSNPSEDALHVKVSDGEGNGFQLRYDREAR